MLELGTCVGRREAPFDGFVLGIAPDNIGGEDALERVFISDSLFQAHVRQHGKFNLCDVKLANDTLKAWRPYFG